MPEQAELWRRTTQRGLLIASYQRTEEKTDMAVTPVAEAVRVPAHLVLPASPAPPSQSTLTGAELPKAKKGLVSTHVGSLVIPNSLPPCGLWPTRLLCQGGSPTKNTGAYWPILVAIPF